MQNFIQNTMQKIKNLSQKRVPLIAILCIISMGAAMFLENSVNTIKIFDGSEFYTVRTLTGNIADALDNVNLKSTDYEIVSVTANGRVKDVAIAYTFPVHITVGEETKTVFTKKATVAEILEDAGFEVGADDMVEPSLNAVIKETTYIDYTSVKYVSGSYTEEVPYETETVYSSAYRFGTSRTEEGKNGLQQVNYTEKIVNGQSVEKVVDSVITLSNTVTQKQIIGTKKIITSEQVKSVSTLTPDAPIELDANGVPVNYSKKMTVQATAYTYTGNNCSTGVAPQPGYIAVNPKIIPYGTKLYIKSSDGKYVYGYAIAADTGGFVKKYPTNVDLFFSTQSACAAFGRRDVEIYVIG